MPKPIILTLLFVACFVGTMLASDSLFYRAPGDFRNLVRELKNERFTETKDNYDIVFVGSSHVNGGINAPLFDSALEDLGYPQTSYNYGTPAYRGHEIDHRVRSEILAQEPLRLKIIVIDLLPFDDYNNRLNTVMREAVSWHTPYQTLNSIRTIRLAEGYTSRNKELRIRAHLLHLGLNYSNLGAAIHFFKNSQPVDSRVYRLSADQVRTANGYLSRAMQRLVNPDSTKGHAQFLKQAESFLSRAEALRSPPATDVSDYNIDAFKRQHDAIMAAGIIPVYMTFPSLFDYSFVYLYAATMPEAIILRYDGPQRIEWAYEIENRHDNGHLNDTGTARFSILLAGDILRAVQGQHPGFVDNFKSAPIALDDLSTDIDSAGSAP